MLAGKHLSIFVLVSFPLFPTSLWAFSLSLSSGGDRGEAGTRAAALCSGVSFAGGLRLPDQQEGLPQASIVSL